MFIYRIMKKLWKCLFSLGSLKCLHATAAAATGHALRATNRGGGCFSAVRNCPLWHRMNLRYPVNAEVASWQTNKRGISK